MIFLIILVAVLLLLLAILFLPIDVSVGFLNDFYVKVKFAGIKVFETDGKDNEDQEQISESDESEPDKPKKEDSAPKKLFGFLKEKYGFIGAVKTLFSFFSDVLYHIKKFLKHIKIKKVILNLTVAGQDAAQTAIEYGVACATVYPVTAMLSSCAEIRFKSINVKSDFNSKKCEFGFSASVRLRAFFLGLTAFKVYKEYKQFLLKENYNERK